MTTRIGKIGRLPKSIREELGQRIENGAMGTEIVQWLNSQPEVQAVLAKYFAGRPVNEQNLCDWKQNGHADWVRRQEACDWAREMKEQAGDLAEATWDRELTDALALVLAKEIGQLGAELAADCTDAKERWGRLREMNRELSLLRRDADRRERTRHQAGRWQWQMDRQDELDEKQREQERREEGLNRYSDRMDMPVMVELFGARAAERMYRIKYGLLMDDLNDGTWEAKQQKAKVQGPKSKIQSGKAAKRKHSTSKETIAKAKRSRVIKADQGGKTKRDEQPSNEATTGRKSADTGRATTRRQGWNLATEKLGDRKMDANERMANDEPADSLRAEEVVVLENEALEQESKSGTAQTGNAPGLEINAPGAVNPGESSLIKANQGQTTDWDETNQIYWTKKELEELAELRRRKQKGGNSGASNPGKATETDETDGGQGATTGMGETQEPIAPPAAEAKPKLTARERYYNMWCQMNRGVIPYDGEKLEMLHAEANEEEQKINEE